MTTVSVLIPWREGCPSRERAWAWVQARYRHDHPDWELVEGRSSEGPFNRSEAIVDAALRSTGSVLVVADADVWCDPEPAVAAVDEHGWAIPHLLIHRLSEAATLKVLDGQPWTGQQLSGDNRQDRRPYKGHETGTLVALRRDVLLDVPPDIRFVGWGQEDDAWALALRELIGRPWRGRDDLFHLWHPAPPRLTRRVGSQENLGLFRRYQAAAGKPRRMRELVDEPKGVVL